MGKVNIPVAEKEFNIADYIKDGSGTIIMKSPTPLLLAKADNHGSRFAMDLGIADMEGERIDRLINTEVTIFTLENILYDKSTKEPIPREVIENIPADLFDDIVGGMYESYDLPLEETPGISTKKE